MSTVLDKIVQKRFAEQPSTWDAMRRCFSYGFGTYATSVTKKATIGGLAAVGLFAYFGHDAANIAQNTLHWSSAAEALHSAANAIPEHLATIFDKIRNTSMVVAAGYYAKRTEYSPEDWALDMKRLYRMMEKAYAVAPKEMHAAMANNGAGLQQLTEDAWHKRWAKRTWRNVPEALIEVATEARNIHDANYPDLPKYGEQDLIGPVRQLIEARERNGMHSWNFEGRSMPALSTQTSKPASGPSL